MQSPSETFEIQHAHEFRSILQDISQQNDQSIKDYLYPLLEDSNSAIKKTASVCIEELTKKQQALGNVVEFALHLLNELESKHDVWVRASDQLKKLNVNFEKLLGENQELSRKLELTEEENYQFKQKLLETETYISEASQLQQPLQDNLTDDWQIHPISISSMSKKFSHLTQRQGLELQTSIDDFHSKIHSYEQKLTSNSIEIHSLEHQVQQLQTNIAQLQNQLQNKQQQLTLNEFYFKEKLDLIALNQSFNQPQELQISQIELNSVFKKDLLRVNSAASILSVPESQSSSDSEISQVKGKHLSHESPIKKTNHVRQSLLRDFVTDFDFELHASLDESIVHRESFDSSCILKERRKSISVSTADMKKTTSKGVQTAFDPITTIIRRPSNQYDCKPKSKTDNSSFLGLSSITSIFSKKNIPEQKTFCQQLEAQPKQDYSILGESIGDLFKGILDYATKKIVTDRVHKKNKTNLNQSFTEELNKATPKNKNYAKGIKNLA